MLARPRSAPRSILSVELLEQRLVPTGTSLYVPLDATFDRFGNQIITVQAYEDAVRSAFGIFDTGASALTFSAPDQARFTAHGVPIPIKIRRGAVAEGLGGAIIGDVSMPGTILADGLHAASLSFDALGRAQFDIHFYSGGAATPGIQAFVGTPDGSPMVPTITGMPILDAGGLAAFVDMSGATFDFSQEFPGFILSLPDLRFVSPGTVLSAGPNSRGPVRVPLTLAGVDNYLSPGNFISEARIPFQNNVSLVSLLGSVRHQSFLFDTGAQVTVISTRQAKALGLDLEQPEFMSLLEGVGGSKKVAGYTLDELDLPTSDGGSLQFAHVPVFVADLGDGVDGVLGMNLFNTAAAMLYDPFGPGGPSVSFTFYKPPYRAGDGTPDAIAKLEHLGISFAGAIHGDHVPGFDFNTGTISGQVFLDFNGNGIADQGEPGLAGQKVFLDLNNSGRWDSGDPITTTDQNGFYQFTRLAAGTYTVRDLVSADFATVFPAGAFARVVVENGAAISAVNFGNLAMQPNATTAYVAGLYGHLLDRAPDAAGLTNWVQLLNQGMPRERVARAIWESAEHRGRQVDTFFRTYLHREADAPGRLNWVNVLLSGRTEAEVERAFLTSPEYQATHRDDSAFLTGLYEDVLGREPDAAGELGWQQALQNGLTRAQVAQSIVTSDEAYQRSLDRYYVDFLHREADLAGRQAWLGLLHSGRKSLEQVGEFFLGSDEFWLWAKRLSKS